MVCASNPCGIQKTYNLCQTLGRMRDEACLLDYMGGCWDPMVLVERVGCLEGKGRVG